MQKMENVLRHIPAHCKISYLEIYFSGFKKKQWQLVLVEDIILIELDDKLGESIKIFQSIWPTLCHPIR